MRAEAPKAATRKAMRIHPGFQSNRPTGRNKSAIRPSGKLIALATTAARDLGLTVVMLRRPPLPAVPTVATIEDALGWIDHAPAPSADRDV